MKKFAVILVILSLTRIGVAYADTTNGADSQNYIFGTKSAAANLNQVLALLVGPKGDPGPAGVAGKDGLIGMDGKDGRDGKDGLNGLNGLDGAPGAVGQAGTSGAGVLSVAFTGVQGGCVSGGVKFTDGAGKITYACNGTNGTDGGGGTTTTVTQVVTGPVSGYTYAQGAVLVGTCDSFVAIKPIRSFTRMGFGFSGFVIGDTSTVVNVDSSTTLNGGISTDCNANPVLIEFFTDSAYADAPYAANDHIVCTSRSSIGSYGAVTNGSRAVKFNGGNYAVPPTGPNDTAGRTARNNALASGDFKCEADSAPNAYFALVFINTADYTDKIGFQIG
jgi:hypothetical protein